MGHQLEKTINKTKEIAEKMNVAEEDLDVRVTKDEYKEEKAEKMSTNHTSSSTHDRHSWMQQANIIFLFLHPQIGKMNTELILWRI
jgi:hypothetical protein